MTQGKQLDKLKKLADTAGIDVDALVVELSGGIEANIAGKLTAALQDIEMKLGSKIEQTGRALGEQISTLVDSAVTAKLPSMVEDVGGQFVEKLKERGSVLEARGNEGEISTNTRGSGLEQYLPLVLDKLVGGNDSLDNTIQQLTKLGQLKQALDSFGSPEASPDAQWRFGQQAYIEGLKTGRGQRGETANPLSPSESPSPSTKLGDIFQGRNKKKVIEELKEVIEVLEKE